MTFVEHEDRTHQGRVDRLVQVAWGKDRAWHGDKVWVHVRTENVVDGTKVEVSIFVGPRDELVDTLPELSIAANAADHDHTIDWKDKNMLLKDDRSFVLKATLKLEHEITSTASPALYVDREPPVFSL